VDDTPPGIRRLCVAVAAEEFPDAGTMAQQSVRSRISAALLDAWSSAELDRVLVNAHRTGDIEVALLPVGIDEPRVIPALIGALAQTLRHVNAGQDDGARIRLRMAIHEGITILTAEGFTGQAVGRVCQLAGSQPLRAALAAERGADLAVLLSDQVFTDLIQFSHVGLSRSQFRRAEVGAPAAGCPDAGWIFVPENALR
jgi:hypothetical protein